MKILIIEDDALIALDIKELVEKLGHKVLAVFDEAASALAYVKTCKPDFVFMDIEINGPMHGIECARTLNLDYQIPSYFVTSHTETDTIADAMDAEPLGYLSKPFEEHDVEVALALASKALKRHDEPKSGEKSIQLGSYTFYPEFNMLKLEGKIVDLRPQELKIVSVLFKNIGNTVSTEELMNHVWEDGGGSSSALVKSISRTREALVGLSIATVANTGYCIQLAD